MRLYSLPLSAFAARCRVTIREKGLPIEIVAPPGGVSSDAYGAITILRRVPALQLDDGNVIVESDVIMEYLDDRFPEHPQRPDNIGDLARMRMAMRIVDNYIAQQLGRLLRAEPGSDAAEADAAAYRAGLGYLAHTLSESELAVGAKMTLADASISTMMYVAYAALHTVGKVPFEGAPRIDSYMRRVAQRPAVRETLQEQCEDLPPQMRTHGDAFFAEYPA